MHNFSLVQISLKCIENCIKNYLFINQQTRPRIVVAFCILLIFILIGIEKYD